MHFDFILSKWANLVPNLRHFDEKNKFKVSYFGPKFNALSKKCQRALPLTCSGESSTSNHEQCSGPYIKGVRSDVRLCNNRNKKIKLAVVGIREIIYDLMSALICER